MLHILISCQYLSREYEKKSGTLFKARFNNGRKIKYLFMNMINNRSLINVISFKQPFNYEHFDIHNPRIISRVI